jgi:hypothetical protein
MMNKEVPMLTGVDYSAFSDLFKDVNGFRPRGALIEFESVEDYNRQMDRLVEDLEQNMADEARAEDQALRDFNAYIDGLVADFGVSRGTVVRWDMEAEGIDNDDFGYYLWNKGLVSHRVVADLYEEFGYVRF